MPARHRPTRCLDGRLMRYDPQPDDPSLETDIGACPECDGRGCEPPKAQCLGPPFDDNRAVLVSFSKPLTDAEFLDFCAYCREWVR